MALKTLCGGNSASFSGAFLTSSGSHSTFPLRCLLHLSYFLTFLLVASLSWHPLFPSSLPPILLSAACHLHLRCLLEEAPLTIRDALRSPFHEPPWQPVLAAQKSTCPTVWKVPVCPLDPMHLGIGPMSGSLWAPSDWCLCSTESPLEALYCITHWGKRHC